MAGRVGALDARLVAAAFARHVGSRAKSAGLRETRITGAALPPSAGAVSRMWIGAPDGTVLGMMTGEILHTLRELHCRISDGIYVRLLWSEHDGRVTVAVADSKTGDGFVVDVRESDSALDVFNHPYAYAACRGVDTRAGAGGAELVGLLAA